MSNIRAWSNFRFAMPLEKTHQVKNHEFWDSYKRPKSIIFQKTAMCDQLRDKLLVILKTCLTLQWVDENVKGAPGVLSKWKWYFMDCSVHFLEVLESQHALFTDLIMKNYLIGNWKWRRWFPQRVHEKTYARNGWGLCYQQKTFWSCFWLNQRGPVSSHSRSPRLVLKYNVKTVVEKR